MNTYSKQILIALLLILGVSGCKDKPCNETGDCPPEYYRFRLNESANYIWADTGSWWIYKNTQTGELDTQTVTYFKFDSVIVKGTYDYSKHITIEDDILEREIFSTYSQWLYSDKTERHHPNTLSGGASLSVILNRNVSSEGEIYPFFYPFNVDYVTGNGSSSTYCRGVDSSIVVQGKTYFNVVRFELDKDDIWERKLNCIRSNNIYYWAKDVGLIKKQMKTCNYSWELIDYKIYK